MPREIKFRAWNKETNHMNAVNGLSYNAADDQLSHASLRVDRLTSYVVRISVLKLMQFTGLTDRLGKEIYEGDILDNSSGMNNDVVKWGRLGAGEYETDCYGWIVPQGLEEWHIIGNIYENPELIKE